MTARALAILISATLTLAACGEPSSNDTSSGSNSGGGSTGVSEPNVGSDKPVSGKGNDKGKDGDSFKMKAEQVTPNPDAIDPRPSSFDKVKVLDERTVRVFFYQGVAPCSVLQRVDVEYGTETVGLTLFVGREETDEDVACIEIAVYNSVDVELDEPIDGRKIVDGAA